MSHLRRVPVPPAPIPGNAGVTARYPLDQAVWIWHSDDFEANGAVLEFLLRVDLAEAGRVEIDVTADQRFVLSVDGGEIGRGPDRAELRGWSFHRYAGTLGPGTHELRARCWWLTPETRPCAQVSARPGFALTGRAGDRPLSTGVADWRVRELRGWTPRPRDKRLAYHVIGCGFDWDGAVEPGDWRSPVEVARGMDSATGCVATPWRLEPSPLPEQRRTMFKGGRIRMAQTDQDSKIRGESDAADWRPLTHGKPVTVPADTRLRLLWDLEDYVCGYSRLLLEGGAGAEVEVEWAESLYESETPEARTAKGNRADCEGKTWLGFGDRVRHPGGDRVYESLWWRSGRWIRLAVTTASEPLVLKDVRPLTTNYPYERAWAFEADAALADALEICESGLRHCAHETFVDCPYYEQMQYLGDTRIQALTWLTASGDPRPVRRALELFDRSRWVNGFHAERCPALELQMSATYSLVYPPLLRDYAMWVDDPETVRRLLPGCRSALEHALACLDGDGLPSALPGWLFVDWVEQPLWRGGVPLGEGVTAPVALHLPLALDAAAELEDVFGEPLLAARWRLASADAVSAIIEAFYQPDHGCFSDDREARWWSEHAQALALECLETPEDIRESLVRTLEHPPEHFARATIYFSYHVHEALLKTGRTETVLKRFDFWRALKEQGFTTTVEAPEPARSDCHGWGAHPLYHCLSALAGVRPAEAGFKRVRVTPRFGKLPRLKAAVPHPEGKVTVELTNDNGILRGFIDTPVPGVLEWNGEERAIRAGRTDV